MTDLKNTYPTTQDWRWEDILEAFDSGVSKLLLLQSSSAKYTLDTAVQIKYTSCHNYDGGHIKTSIELSSPLIGHMTIECGSGRMLVVYDFKPA